MDISLSLKSETVSLQSTLKSNGLIQLIELPARWTQGPCADWLPPLLHWAWATPPRPAIRTTKHSVCATPKVSSDTSASSSAHQEAHVAAAAWLAGCVYFAFALHPPMPVGNSGWGARPSTSSKEGRTTVQLTLPYLHLGVHDLPPFKAFGNDNVAIIGLTGKEPPN